MSFTNDQEPTPEFRARLRTDVVRAFRSDERFGPRAAPAPTRRLATFFGVAAGVVLTLVTGMVLGASASYASAAELDAHQREANTSILGATRQLIAGQLNLARTNYERVHAAFAKGGATQTAVDAAAAQVDTLERSIARLDLDLTASRATTPPSRSPLAILPIKALNAIACVPAPTAPQASQAALVTQPAVPVASVARRTDEPNRALIAALATLHMPDVVKGQVPADYIVMVLDAVGQYVWSTSGTQNVIVEAGGGLRTVAEHREYTRIHRAELMGTAAMPGFDFNYSGLDYAYIAGGGARGGRGARGSANDSAGGGRRTRLLHDSLSLRLIVRDSLALSYLSLLDSAGRVGRGGRGGDSSLMYVNGVLETRRVPRRTTDSTGARYMDIVVQSSGARGRGGDARPSDPTTIKVGWSSTQNSLTNQAPGLEEPGNGLSGILGLPAASVSSGEHYVFPAGELGPTMIRVVVAHLMPGVVWKGR